MKMDLNAAGNKIITIKNRTLKVKIKNMINPY